MLKKQEVLQLALQQKSRKATQEHWEGITTREKKKKTQWEEISKEMEENQILHDW